MHTYKINNLYVYREGNSTMCRNQLAKLLIFFKKKKNMEDKAINLSLSFHLYLSTWPVIYYASYWWSGGGGTTRGFKLNITALLAMIPTWQFGKAISLSVNLPRIFIFWQRLIKLKMIPTWRREHYIATCIFSNLWETVYKSCYI